MDASTLLSTVLPSPLQHRLRMLKNINLRRGEPEFIFVARHFPAMQTAIDVGANLGIFSQVLAHHAQHVLSIEPCRRLSTYLLDVLPPHCTVVPTALSDQSGTAILKTPIVKGHAVHGQASLSPTSHQWDTLSVDRQTEETVKTMTLDHAVKTHLPAQSKVEFVKIDVEGHEWSVILGATETIRQHQPIFLVETEYRHGAPVEDIFEFYNQRNYQSYSLNDERLYPIDASMLRQRQTDEDLKRKIQHQSYCGYINNIFFIPRDYDGPLTPFIALT